MSLNNMSTPTVTGWSNFWGSAPNAYAMLYRDVGSADFLPGGNSFTGLARLIGRSGMRGLNRKMKQLIGNGVSGNATATVKRIEAPNGITDSEQLGGVRTIETVSAFPGDADGTVAVAAKDRDGIIDMLDRFYATNNPATYPTDASGNGGGAKVGR